MDIKRPTLKDREDLCHRPPGKSHVMYQSWQNLLFLHWEVEADEIRAKLPSGLYVDTFEQRAFVGIVPFYMRHIRPRFLPEIPNISNFLELNVRTYVHDANGVPGVWFFSLDTNQSFAAWCGRRFFHMPYTVAAMRAEQNDGDSIQYQCHRKGQLEEEVANYQYQGISKSAPAVPGTIGYFFAERYLLYAMNPANGNLFSGRVYHEPYPLQKAKVPQFSLTPMKQAGFTKVSGAPVHSAFSAGVDVLAYPLEQLTNQS